MFDTSTLEKPGFLLLLFSVTLALGCEHSTPVNSVSAPDSKNVSNNQTVQVQTALSTTNAEGNCCEDDIEANRVALDQELKIEQLSGGVVIPDVGLLNQDGQKVRFRSDLIKDKIVAVNFIFTTCKGICPPMCANFAQLQKQLGDKYGEDVVLVSVSVDPGIDTPQRLKAWRESFGGKPGWNLLTGSKQDVDYLLKEMEVFSADKNDHSPFILLGDEAEGKWSRVHGLTSPETLANVIAELHAARQTGVKQTSAEQDAAQLNRARQDTGETADKVTGTQAEEMVVSKAQNYFTDVELVNQHGEKMRLYSDLLKDKVVVINSFFSTCKGSCPVMLSSFARIQEQFADQLGKDLLIISITVDPKTDTPQILSALAGQWKARPGWYFLTGEKTNVDAALYKLGHYVEDKESHSNIFIIGNEATGLWKKARGLSDPEQIFPLIEDALNDEIPASGKTD